MARGSAPSRARSTLFAFGARKRNVTVLSARTSGDTRGAGGCSGLDRSVFCCAARNKGANSRSESKRRKSEGGRKISSGQNKLERLALPCHFQPRFRFLQGIQRALDVNIRVAAGEALLSAFFGVARAVAATVGGRWPKAALSSQLSAPIGAPGWGPESFLRCGLHFLRSF